MAQKEFDLKATVHRLLTPQETLAPWIFDENQKMLPDVRQELLKIAQKIIDETITPIDGLEIADVCLQGSSSDYFYHDKSDIDLFIEVHNNSCSSIANDQKHFDMFLSSQMRQFKKYRFTYQDRLVDIKMGSKPRQLVGTYSILYNSWLVEPNKDIIKDLSEENMIAYYEKRRREILEEKQKIIEKYSGMKLGSALNDFYVEMVLCNLNIKDYYVFKLLNYERILKPIGAESIYAYNRVLSL